MNTRTFTLLTLFALSGLLTSCLKDNVAVQEFNYTDQEFSVISRDLNLPIDRDDYLVHLPQHMMGKGFIPPSINSAKATLGRVLFYDTKLSRNNSVSCASCHKQELAFSDDLAFSKGFDGQLTKRNSLPLASTANFEASYGGGGAFNGLKAGFFWDERAQSIHDQSKLTIQDDIEMGMDMNALPGKLANEEYYHILFKKAYGDDIINENRILESIQEFVNAFFCVDSKFDEGLNRTNDPFSSFPNYSTAENLGKSLFMQHCASCHSRDMSTLSTVVANNGLDAVYADKGLGGISGREQDEGLFKVPFLRNVALTAPYMHDGRFATLADVVEHYSSGIQANPNLDPLLYSPSAPGQAMQMNFTQDQKQALVAFLQTLTDYNFIQDARFSDPFKN